MSRDAIEATLHALYAARQEGDCDAILRHLTPDASYAMMGDAAASPVAGRHQGSVCVCEGEPRSADGPLDSCQNAGSGKLHYHNAWRR